MLEYIVLLGGTILSVFILISKKKQRRDPLKNTDKVALELNTETSLEAFQIYLPTANFITNMSAAVENERLDLRALWSEEKARFPLVWSGFSASQQKVLVNTLIDELKFSIEIYSDTDKFLHLLCPRINEKYLLSTVEGVHIAAPDTAPKPASADSTKPLSSIPGVQELIMCAQSKADLVPFCLPLLVLSAERVEKELDPAGKVKVDIALTQHAEVFLRALQQLCAIKFAKQVLLRYKAEPKKSWIVRTVKNVGPVFLFGVLALLTTYLMDKYGFLDTFMWNYKSPFK